MGLLQKIAWKTRKWNLTVTILDIAIHDEQGSWGINLLDFKYNFRSHSLFCIDFRLPNGGDIKYLSVDHFDFLYLRTPLWNAYDSLSDNKLWGAKLSTIDNIKLAILNKIFK
jgi:hypothetical protein|tara:strand:- start:1404 stop:1739 length:336 start_codon:yes stop_codon:yes gene_type:complete